MSDHFNQRYGNEACLSQVYFGTAHTGAGRKHSISVASDLLKCTEIDENFLKI
jgi:hypothetical protein